MADSLEKVGLIIEHEATLPDKAPCEISSHGNSEGHGEVGTGKTSQTYPDIESSGEEYGLLGEKFGNRGSEGELVEKEADQLSCLLAGLNIEKHEEEAVERKMEVVELLEGIDYPGASPVVCHMGEVDLGGVSCESSLLADISSPQNGEYAVESKESVGAEATTREFHGLESCVSHSRVTQPHPTIAENTYGSVPMVEVHHINENPQHKVEINGQTEEYQAQGELIEVDNASSSDTEIKELGVQLLKNDLKKDETTPYQQDLGKRKDGNLDGVFTPLSLKAEAAVSNALMHSNREKVLVLHKRSNIEVTGAVLQCLLPGSWLNDEVINVYMELLKERELREPEKFLRCHFFNTFFYNKLFKDAQRYDYQAVRRWTTREKLGYNLLECDKILIPIHQNVHWCVAVIDLQRKELLYLDSLQGRDPNVLQALSRYIVDEARERTGQDLDAREWEHVYVDNIPQQHNGCDCGMFMLKYVDFHSRGASLHFTQEDCLGDSPIEGNIVSKLHQCIHQLDLATTLIEFCGKKIQEQIEFSRENTP